MDYRPKERKQLCFKSKSSTN